MSEVADTRVSKIAEETVENLPVNKGGRPTKYRPEIADLMIEYFSKEPGYDVEVENSKGVMQSVRHASDFPTLAGFARRIGVTRDTLHRWATEKDDNGRPKHPEFSDAYRQAKDHQEDILVQNALKGGYQANFSIFTAKNVLGWRDEKHMTHDIQERREIKIIAPGGLNERISHESALIEHEE